MRKALNLLASYFLILILGVVIGTILFSVYLSATEYIASKDVILFSDVTIFKAFFYAAFCMVIFACPFVSYGRIRHVGGLAQAIAYLLICLLNWGLLFPLVTKASDYYFGKHQVTTSYVDYSEDTFRAVGSKVYYFTDPFKYEFGHGYSADAIVIDTSEEGLVSKEKIRDTENLDLRKKAAPFNEIQIKKIFVSGFNNSLIDFDGLIEFGKKCFYDGIIPYLEFLSFALVLCSLYAVTALFSWKLINAITLLMGVIGILVFNTSFYFTFYNFINSRMSEDNFIHILENYIDQPLLCFINCICAMIIIVWGIVRFLVRKFKKD